MDSPNPFFSAIEAQNVKAEVVACDHYRIHGGLAVETDYIVAISQLQQQVESGTSTEPPLLDTFYISKTYSSFRSLAEQLKNTTAAFHLDKIDNLKSDPPACIYKVAKYCQLLWQLIEGPGHRIYLGKVSYMYVQVLAKERKRVINEVLLATVHSHPTRQLCGEHPYLKAIALVIQTFFLTDHCFMDEPSKQSNKRHRKHDSSDLLQKFVQTFSQSNSKDSDDTDDETNATPDVPKGQKMERRSSFVVPLSTRARRDESQRNIDDLELLQAGGEAARLVLNDDTAKRSSEEKSPSYRHPTSTIRSHTAWGIRWFDANPLAFGLICCVAIKVLMSAQQIQVRLAGDISLLLVFAAFCLGLNTPRPLVGGFDRTPTMLSAIVVPKEQDKSGRKLLRRSILLQSPKSVEAVLRQSSSELVDLEELAANEGLQSEVNDSPGLTASQPAQPVEPLALFPPDAKIGEVTNCWSQPSAKEFDVRGGNYLRDRLKVSSGDFLFNARGLDLFLTDTCPENVGSNPALFGGSLREKPTFIINFRLPWGVLVFYAEIPKRFVPIVRAAYEAPDEKPNIEELFASSPSDVCVARFLLGDDEHKNKTLKIVPMVVDGPWIVRSVVGGKPAIIGTKMPVSYHYGPPSQGRELYIEVDLDIAASSAARGILSVARSYTQVLTLNLGFVVQGNSDDELPEQMLLGARLHGINPLDAVAYPDQPTDPGKWMNTAPSLSEETA